MDHDVEVAGGSAVAARTTAALDPDALAVLDPGGDAHLDLPGRVLDTGAVAGRAGVLDPQAGAAAGRAGLAEREQALVVVDHAAAAAASGT